MSRTPVFGARVMAPDSTAVFTDSLGGFAIRLDDAVPYHLDVQQYGYVSLGFDLTEDAPSRLSVLLLEPRPVELAGISVVSQSSVDKLLDQLRRNGNRYPGSLRAFDKERLDERWPGASAWDVVSSSLIGVRPCDSFDAPSRGYSVKSGVCVRGRAASFRDPTPEVPVRVCVDSWESWDAMSELGSLDVREVALIQVYSAGQGGVRVYTAPYLALSAASGRDLATPMPIEFGC